MQKMLLYSLLIGSSLVGNSCSRQHDSRWYPSSSANHVMDQTYVYHNADQEQEGIAREEEGQRFDHKRNPANLGDAIIDQTYVHKYGVEVSQEEWVDRGEEGQIISTMKDGSTVTSNYSEGRLNGETTYTFPYSEVIQRIETYEKGCLVQEKENFRSGAPKYQVECQSPDVKILTGWYENGTPHYRERHEKDRLIEADYYTLSTQVESRIDEGNGKRMNRDECGQLMATDCFKDGRMVLRTTYFLSGATKEIIPYQNGRIHGQKTTYFPDGEPRTIEGWSDGRQQGMTIVFQNGEKIAEIPYYCGSKEGRELRFQDGNRIVEEVMWKNGWKHGPCCRYLGEDVHVTWFYEGREVSPFQYDRLIHPHVG